MRWCTSNGISVSQPALSSVTASAAPVWVSITTRFAGSVCAVRIASSRVPSTASGTAEYDGSVSLSTRISPRRATRVVSRLPPFWMYTYAHSPLGSTTMRGSMARESNPACMSPNS